MSARKTGSFRTRDEGLESLQLNAIVDFGTVKVKVKTMRTE